jgi:hypothetical protein
MDVETHQKAGRSDREQRKVQEVGLLGAGGTSNPEEIDLGSDCEEQNTDYMGVEHVEAVISDAVDRGEHDKARISGAGDGEGHAVVPEDAAMTGGPAALDTSGLGRGRAVHGEEGTESSSARTWGVNALKAEQMGVDQARSLSVDEAGLNVLSGFVVGDPKNGE